MASVTMITAVAAGGAIGVVLRCGASLSFGAGLFSIAVPLSPLAFGAGFWAVRHSGIWQ